MTTPVRTVPLRALGTGVDVQIEGYDAARVEQAVRDRWHLALRDDAEPPAADVVGAELLEEGAEPAEGNGDWGRGSDVVRDQDLRLLLQRLTQNITYAVIHRRAGELLMLHAAGLADPVTGATAVFVAKGNTGKTTLCRTLGPALSYITDETVAVRPDGIIEPYLKPLSTRRPDWVGVKDEQSPASVGLRPCPVDPWVAGIVLLDRRADHAGDPVVEELDTLHAVADLIPESSAFMRTERPLHWLADVLERTGGARRVTYAEVTSIEPLVREICSRESPW